MTENTRIKIDIKMDKSDQQMLMHAFKVMPKDVQDALRRMNQKMVGKLVEQMKQKAHFAPNRKQALLLANSLKANKDRYPSITVGGARKAGVQRKATAGSPKPIMSDLLFGAEFGVKQGGPGTFPQGGKKFAQYSGRQGRGAKGYFIFPTLRANQENIRKTYLETVYKLMTKEWGPDHG